MHDWREYFESPTPLRLYVMHTGEVRSVGTPHLNPKSPNFKKMPKTDEYNPVFAFLVEHPQKGLVLLDTGLHGLGEADRGRPDDLDLLVDGHG